MRDGETFCRKSRVAPPLTAHVAIWLATVKCDVHHSMERMAPERERFSQERAIVIDDRHWHCYRVRDDERKKSSGRRTISWFSGKVHRHVHALEVAVLITDSS